MASAFVGSVAGWGWPGVCIWEGEKEKKREKLHLKSGESCGWLSVCLAELFSSPGIGRKPADECHNPAQQQLWRTSVSVQKSVWLEAAIVRVCVGGFHGFTLRWNRWELKYSGRVERRLKSGHAGDGWRWLKGALRKHGGHTPPPSPPPSQRTLI